MFSTKENRVTFVRWLIAYGLSIGDYIARVQAGYAHFLVAIYYDPGLMAGLVNTLLNGSLQKCLKLSSTDSDSNHALKIGSFFGGFSRINSRRTRILIFVLPSRFVFGRFFKKNPITFIEYHYRLTKYMYT